jgi:hypothetical protein
VGKDAVCRHCDHGVKPPDDAPHNDNAPFYEKEYRKAYMRVYMRKRRERERREKAQNPPKD